MPAVLQPVRPMEMRRFSYWESELPPEPLPPRDLPRRVDRLIVGAGFMGRWLAYFLSKRAQPARTLVIDRDRFSYGASSRNAGFLTCGQVSEMLSDVQHAGIDSREDLDNMVLGHLRAWRDGHADVVTDTVAELTGQEPMSAREWFERNLSQFSGKPSLMQKAAHKMIKARYGGRVLA